MATDRETDMRQRDWGITIRSKQCPRDREADQTETSRRATHPCREREMTIQQSGSERVRRSVGTTAKQRSAHSERQKIRQVWSPIFVSINQLVPFTPSCSASPTTTPFSSGCSLSPTSSVPSASSIPPFPLCAAAAVFPLADRRAPPP